MGSVVGYFCYYYVLSKLSTSTVALVTLITPITALLLGKTYNNEVVSSFIWYGTAFVLFGLVIHQRIGFKLVYRIKNYAKSLQK
jgi:drug/metabolite transporter (DMT)-like permease